MILAGIGLAAIGFGGKYIYLHAFVLFDLILYIPSAIFQLCRYGFPGLNQYQARINVSC